MAKTIVKKIDSPHPDVSIFKINGVLGYHENSVLEKFFGECSKRGIKKLIMDFSELSSLGGGCAKVICGAANEGQVVVCIIGASAMAHSFLEKSGKTKIIYENDLDKALASVSSAAASETGPAATVEDPEPDKPEAAVKTSPTPKKREPKPDSAATEATSDVAVAVEHEEPRTAPAPEKKDTSPQPSADATPQQHDPELERRLVQYRSLFSLNADFSRIDNTKQALDAFLFTIMSQARTESAAFFARVPQGYKLTAWQGFETASPEKFILNNGEVDDEEWVGSTNVQEAEAALITKSGKEKLSEWGMHYAAPFVIHGKLEGIVLLGGAMTGTLDKDTLDYLVLVINQAAIAYQNTRRAEIQNERTRGLVRSLTSMIEEHTLSRGNMESVLTYVHAVARAIKYPAESVNDLIYGGVLRDAGMIKVSDLIVQNDRELEDDEWKIIKRHPIEGADMVDAMGFSGHVRDIVLCHHERFSGGGYPQGIQGTQIPLGARVVSVVESYAVMLLDRPTRPALAPEQALSTLKENFGMRYDPDVVTAFVEIVEEEIRSGEKVVYDSSWLFDRAER